ncbi:F-box/LRR-repeat protein 3, partial [Tanacetum coccineum]
CIITADEVLLLNSLDSYVLQYVVELQRRLKASGANEVWQSDASDLNRWKRSRDSGDVSRNASSDYLPFEFKALEIALEAALYPFAIVVLSDILVALWGGLKIVIPTAAEIEIEAYLLLDELTSTISTLNLERVRRLKSRLVALTQRVEKVRDEIEQLMDDDGDMAEMYLTEKNTRLDTLSYGGDQSISGYRLSDGPHTVSAPVSPVSSPPDFRKLEKSFSFARSRHESMRVQKLKEYIDDTEDFINIQLDNVRNQLIQFELLLTTATFVVAIFGVVAGTFGMNFPITLFVSPSAFEWVLWTYGLLIKFVKLCDEDLRGIAKAFPDLEEVDLSCPRFKFAVSAFREYGVYEIMITDEGVEGLASGLRNLVRINLSKNSLLTDKSMYCLSEKCVRLEEVVFVDCTLITMKGVRFMLDNSRNVRMIGMSVVSGLHGNESLFVDGVRSGRCLSELSFKDSDFSDEFLDGIVEARVPLKSVSFVDCNKYSIGGLLRLLHAYRLIKFLDLSRNYSLSDDSVIVLSECLRDLVTTRFNFCKLTSTALFALIKNCLSLEHVELAHACLGKEEDVVMDVLKRPNLSIKYLNLSANSDMSDECLVKITSVCPNLNLLHVSSCSRITGSVGETLKNCREIRNLSIQDCGGVKNLGLRMESLKLEKLYMGRSGVNNDGLREIAVRCNEIVNIDISGCQYVTTDAVIYMVKKCEKLREVNLMGCSNLNVYIVNWMVHTRPSLRKVIPPSYGVTTESQRLLMLHHGCQVADK